LRPPSRRPTDASSTPIRFVIASGFSSGASYFQIAYRFRLFGGVYLDSGFFAMSGGLDGSIGGLVDVPIAHPWSIYLGAGVGLAGAFGEGDPDGCDPKTTDCPLVHQSSTATYAYARVGAALRFGATARNIVGVDVGAWRGQREEEVEQVVTRRSKFLSPMAGVSYHYAF